MTTVTDAPRPDNLLGICNALGEDFGFDPLWLRIALAAGLLWQPLLMVALYAALGVLVLASRLLFPNRPVVGATMLAADNDIEPAAPLARAA